MTINTVAPARTHTPAQARSGGVRRGLVTESVRRETLIVRARRRGLGTGPPSMTKARGPASTFSLRPECCTQPWPTFRCAQLLVKHRPRPTSGWQHLGASGRSIFGSMSTAPSCKRIGPDTRDGQPGKHPDPSNSAPTPPMWCSCRTALGRTVQPPGPVHTCGPVVVQVEQRGPGSVELTGEWVPLRRRRCGRTDRIQKQPPLARCPGWSRSPRLPRGFLPSRVRSLLQSGRKHDATQRQPVGRVQAHRRWRLAGPATGQSRSIHGRP